MITKIWDRLGVVFFNIIGTHIPVHAVRQGILRLWGAKIGRDTSIFMGSTVFGIEKLKIGEACSIGFRCLLDARGGLTIGDNVVIASDTHFIGGYHDISAPDFAAILVPITVEDYVWIASRATITGARIGRGAVIGACSLVRKDVAPLDIVAGVPAKVVGTRDAAALAYRPKYRPPLF
ncbi:acyltransferase [Rhodococcus tibetensis]|uniref:Acyltransferase n=1 Tax=Rhodococcus tibetensis TaxID=2965064 RepID=A0ABT1QF32_9NOCA|nr:acyltransferase [Rhodococcus sp. FXJ9.536]MCQ4120899.1 acyltransferase [Rhodococcus sp. FXJ9.536]